MKAKCFITITLLMVVSVQAIWAQKVVLYPTGKEPIEYEIAELDSITFIDAEPFPAFLTCPDNNHPHAIDLGLPSGTKWCCCNVGASTPEDSGGYYAWGETEPKSMYNWNTYKWMNKGQSSWKQVNKYTFADGQKSACWYDAYGNFIGDGLTELLPEDDAATANWGSGWRMPSLDQFKELINSSHTTTVHAMQNGKYGIKITSSSNGASIFLVYAGRHSIIGFNGGGGSYWSRSLGMIGSDCAYMLDFGFDGKLLGIDWSDGYYRCYGLSVRPVRVP